MNEQPTIQTDRLVLRPFTINDAERVQSLAGDEKIADVTVSIPHPYPDGAAKDWISLHPEKWQKRQGVAFAIILKEPDLLIGCVSIMNIQNNIGELGYWIGVEYWNKGYCTEACKSLINFSFSELGLKKLFAKHLTRNPASGKVLIKSGLYLVKEETDKIKNKIEEFRIYEMQCT